MDLLGGMFVLGKFQEGKFPFRYMMDEELKGAYGAIKVGPDCKPTWVSMLSNDLLGTPWSQRLPGALVTVLLHEQCHAYLKHISCDAGHGR